MCPDPPFRSCREAATRTKLFKKFQIVQTLGFESVLAESGDVYHLFYMHTVYIVVCMLCMLFDIWPTCTSETIDIFLAIISVYLLLLYYYYCYYSYYYYCYCYCYYDYDCDILWLELLLWLLPLLLPSWELTHPQPRHFFVLSTGGIC